jgi:hypothetical protein
MLWVNDIGDGRRVLSGVEVAWLDNPPSEIPPPALWDPPEPDAP